MKKFILVTMIAAAAMFSACGDDDDNGTSAGGSDFGGSSDSKASSSEVVVPTSSGGSGSTVSCDIKISMNSYEVTHFCMEAPIAADAALRKECNAINGQEEEEQGAKVIYSGKFGSGCASGSKKTCTASKNGVDVSIFVYDAVTSSMECSDIIGGYAR